MDEVDFSDILEKTSKIYIPRTGSAIWRELEEGREWKEARTFCPVRSAAKRESGR